LLPDSGALTRLIDQLEARGLVERERSREDRRAVQLRLTAAGIATLASLLPKVVDKLNFTLREFTHAEANELTRLLTKLITSLEGSSAESGAAA
jgi:DNA-binding MarR family transcriptional regulator